MAKLVSIILGGAIVVGMATIVHAHPQIQPTDLTGALHAGQSSRLIKLTVVKDSTGAYRHKIIRRKALVPPHKTLTVSHHGTPVVKVKHTLLGSPKIYRAKQILPYQSPRIWRRADGQYQ